MLHAELEIVCQQMTSVVIAAVLIAVLLGTARARWRSFRAGREFGNSNPNTPDTDGDLEPTEGGKMIVEEWRNGDLVTVDTVTFDRPGNR